MSDSRSECESFETRLLESNQEPGLDAWRTHLDECAGCRAQWQMHRLLLASFAGEIIPDLSPAFEDGLQRKIERSIEVKPLTGWRAAAMIGYGLLAALLLRRLFSEFPPAWFDPSSPWIILTAIAAVPVTLWLTIGATRRLPSRVAKPPLASLCLLVLVLLVTGCTRAGATSEPRLLRQSYQSPAEGVERDYFVYLPAGYEDESSSGWPVMLFLHGNGERGNAREDLDFVLMHGPLYEAWIQKRDLPFIIVSPQLPLFGLDQTVDYLRDREREDIPRRLEDGVPPRPEEFPTPGPITGALPDPDLSAGPEGPPAGWNRLEADLLQILDEVLGSFRTDPSRVYLTGISYGGYGTWYLASRHPDRFAAISPVVAWGHPKLMPPLAQRQIPLWVFAGGRDSTVQMRYFYPGLNALEGLGHREVRFTVHEDMGHDAWRRVYAGNDLYDWFLEHRLTPAP